MSGYPYNGNPQQYPPPQGQIYPQIYNNAFNPAPQPMQPGFGYPYQPAQPPTAMSYPNMTPAVPTAPTAPGFAYAGYPAVAPIMVYAPSVEWVPTTSMEVNALANRAVIAGYEGHDGSPLWVIRARFEGDLIPGKLAIKHRAAYVPWGGKENSVANFEVCCAPADKIKWVGGRDGIVPPNAVIGGNTETGEPLYVGRVKHEGSLTPGKVHPSHGVMYISFAGKEIPHKVYEIMCNV